MKTRSFNKKLQMPPSKQFLAKFEETNFYHVICKAIDGKTLFKDEENKRYFLERYLDFSNEFFDTYAYSLLDNHVHFLIKTKSQLELKIYLNQLEINQRTSTFKRFIEDKCSFHELIEQQFNRLFISYSLSFNLRCKTSGPLFNRPFKRVEVADNAHLTQLYVYIHANIMKHGLSNDYENYKWSSYRAIISDKPTNILREEVLKWFGGKERFIQAHKDLSEFYYNHPLGGE
jgi:REP element-mobilizing transposase RayT